MTAIRVLPPSDEVAVDACREVAQRKQRGRLTWVWVTKKTVPVLEQAPEARDQRRDLVFGHDGDEHGQAGTVVEQQPALVVAVVTAPGDARDARVGGGAGFDEEISHGWDLVAVDDDFDLS